MNKKQFLVLVVLVVLLGLWSSNRRREQSSSWSGGGKAVGQKLLGDFDVNAVAQIAIKQGQQELLLAKQDDVWRVAQRDNYPANFSEISLLLLKLKDLKIVQTEQIGPTQLPRLELAPGGAAEPTVVEFRDAAGKAFKTLTLGKKHMKTGGANAPMDEFGGGGGFADGRYVQVNGALDSVALISDPLDTVATEPGRWLNKTFFKVEKPRRIAVTFPEATNSWVLTRETENGEWQLADARPEEKLDSGTSASVTSPFSSPSLNDIALGLTPEESGLATPTIIKITTFEGFDYTVKVGAKHDDHYLLTLAVAGSFPKERAAVADESPEAKTTADQEFAERRKQLEERLATESALNKWTFEVATWSVAPLLKKRAELLVEETAETATEQAEAIGETPIGQPPGF